MPQSSLAIAQEIEARGVAKSAKNVFHYNTQKLLWERCDQRKEKEKEKRTLNRVSKQTADPRGKHYSQNLLPSSIKQLKSGKFKCIFKDL